MDVIDLIKRLRALHPADLDVVIAAFADASPYFSANAPAEKVTELIRWATRFKRLDAVVEAIEQLSTATPAAGGKDGRGVPPYPAAASGGGATATGNRALAVGKGGVGVGGDVYGNVTIGGRTEDSAHVAALREAYLNSVFESVGHLALAGIDPKAKSDAESRLDLASVYTALMTLTPAALPGKREEAGADPGMMAERGKRCRSAVEMLDRCPRLVLLGEPGSGKSTFMNFAALCHAGEVLSRPEANLAILTAPLPGDERERARDRERKSERQPWRHGALLPVHIVLRDFAARGLPEPGEPGTAEQLRSFIEAELKTRALGEFAPHLFRELRAQGGLVLLDGLDEVPEAGRRREQLKQAVEGFAAAFPKSRLLVTSRTYAYQNQEWRLNGFDETVLAPLDDVQIHLFVERWHLHIARLRGLDEENARGSAELLRQAIDRTPRLRELAARPLLLALTTSLHAWRGGTLPEKREMLYADTVDLLLDWWEQAKVIKDRTGAPVVIQPTLVEWLRTDRERMRGMLNELAYEAHASQRERTGTADIAETRLIQGLMAVNSNLRKDMVNPASLTNFLCNRAGLLIPRGVGVYTFPHRTFQEYLAACYLTDHDYPEKLAELARADPDRWREAVLLAAAKAARGTEAAVWLLVDELCPEALQAEAATSQADAWGALLAGQALAESVSPGKVPVRCRALLERLKTRLVRVMGGEGRLPAIERARAGDALAALGDPRPGVTDVDRMEFCLVPAGEFLMGSMQGDGGADESPRHKVTLTRDYWVSKYPVTVAQFRAFVDATGRKPEGAESLSRPVNRPVTGVTWHEAVAFCEWLTERRRVQGQLPERWRITLPTEAEREKTARGGLQVPRKPVVHVDLMPETKAELVDNPDPLRRYPWLGDADPEKANCDESEIGDSSAVGCFPQGAGPYGAEELSGNVWEWCLDGKREYTGDPQTDPLGPTDESAGRVVRGGSCWSFAWGCRSAYRLRIEPGDRGRSLGFRLAAGRELETSKQEGRRAEGAEPRGRGTRPPPGGPDA